MNEQTQRIQLDGATRVTLDIVGSDLNVSWREDLDAIQVSGQELTVERTADEIFLRAERRGHRGRGGLFDLLPNISTPGVTIDWSGSESSIEVSDEDGVKISTGLGRAAGGPGSGAIGVELPVAIQSTSIELEHGDLRLTAPTGKIDSQLKHGNMSLTGGEAEMTASMGSGNADVRDFAGTLNVMGGSGNIELTDCRAMTSLKAGSGEVSLTRVNGDWIDVMAGSGDVEARHCTSSAFSCQTGSGDVELVDGELEQITVRSGSGDVQSTAMFGPHSQSFMTGSGSVSLGIPRGLPARLEVSTQGGEIDSDVQLVSVGQRGPRSRRTRRQVGSIGNGEPRAEVSIRTGTGDIKLHWLIIATEIPVPRPPVPSQPPTAPEAPDAPSPPPPSDESVVETVAPTRDPRLDVLEALARGEITADEADVLLERVDARGE